MSKTINLAKLTLAFVVIAVGFSLFLGTLMGGGLSRSYDELKGVNNDPRSISVQALLIETDDIVTHPVTLPTEGTSLSDKEFNVLLSQADHLRRADGARVRTPSLLVQHAETGSIRVRLGDRVFEAGLAPRVIDTKHGPVLRVAIQIQRADIDSSATPRELTFATAYTSAPGSSIVFDLADLGLPGTHATLVLRTTLIDPTPTSGN